MRLCAPHVAARALRTVRKKLLESLEAAWLLSDDYNGCKYLQLMGAVRRGVDAGRR
jgi:hypothetical protein